MLPVKSSGKRQRPSSELSTPPRKRPRSNIDYSSLSHEDEAIVQRAAEILSVEISELPVAIRNLYRTRRTSGETRQNFRSPPPRKMRWPLNTSKSPGASCRLQPRSPVPNLGGVTKEGHEVIADDDSPHGFCLSDKVFGCSITPGPWADCFRSSPPPGSNLTGGATHAEGYHYGPVSAYSDNAPFENSIFPDRGLCPPNFQQYGQNFPEHTPVAAQLNQLNQHVDFTSDDNFSIEEFLSHYPPLQPMKLETMQPLAANPEMRYAENGSLVDRQFWNQTSMVHKPINAGPELNHGPGGHEQEGIGLGSDAGELSEAGWCDRSGPPRRGPFRNLHDRAQTAQTRRLTACLRCRMQRIRCNPDPNDPGGVCLTCTKVSIVKIAKLPCLRWKITEVRLFKPGQVPGLEWTERWSDARLVDISKWRSTETKSIQTTEGYSPKTLKLEVREFIPIAGDKLSRHWWAGGVRKSVQVPAYALSNIAAAEQTYKEYITRDGVDFFKAVLKDRGKLLWDTYSAAIEASNSPNTPKQEALLLKMVLQLWVAIRITTRSIRICGEETLGMPRDILDETSPLHGQIPVPPVMGAQIELIMIHRIQVPLRVRVLDLLQKVILANQPKSWFTIYLCVFVLLHNCALISKYDTGYARKHGFKGRYARPDMIKESHTGANILLAYWHYFNKGYQHFESDGDATGFFATAELTPQQMNFVKGTSRYVKANENTFQAARRSHAYENDFYFVSQLYEADWQPRTTVF